MALGRKQGCNYLGWLVVLGLEGAIASMGNCAFAQVAPDVTLQLNSVVRSNGNNFTITGGTLLGGNLFHSLRHFSVPTNGEAFFNKVTVTGRGGLPPSPEPTLSSNFVWSDTQRPSMGSRENPEGVTEHVTGRGGLPPSPEPTLSSNFVWSDTQRPSMGSRENPEGVTEHRLSKTSVPIHSQSKALEIVPEEGWLLNNKGEVVLIAQSAHTVYLSSSLGSSCYAQ